MVVFGIFSIRLRALALAFVVVSISVDVVFAAALVVWMTEGCFWGGVCFGNLFFLVWLRS
ncbi:hypothetical protein GQ42DRAFT_46150 [Ramicandelaber brevisporus]|nr:hypothetical protein GQ42DRAFT_46150 [Ramicandelaber brevisporus]